MSFRALKDEARRALHDAMQVPAFYFANPLAVGVPLNVRIHNQPEDQGALPLGGKIYAERAERIPTIIFLLEDGIPANKSAIYVSATEVYRIVNVLPADGITVTAEAVLMHSAEAARYTPPVMP